MVNTRSNQQTSTEPLAYLGNVGQQGEVGEIVIVLGSVSDVKTVIVLFSDHLRKLDKNMEMGSLSQRVLETHQISYPDYNDYKYKKHHTHLIKPSQQLLLDEETTLYGFQSHYHVINCLHGGVKDHLGKIQSHFSRPMSRAWWNLDMHSYVRIGK